MATLLIIVHPFDKEDVCAIFLGWTFMHEQLWSVPEICAKNDPHKKNPGHGETTYSFLPHRRSKDGYKVHPDGADALHFVDPSIVGMMANKAVKTPLFRTLDRKYKGQKLTKLYKLLQNKTENDDTEYFRIIDAEEQLNGRKFHEMMAQRLLHAIRYEELLNGGQSFDVDMDETVDEPPEVASPNLCEEIKSKHYDLISTFLDLADRLRRDSKGNIMKWTTEQLQNLVKLVDLHQELYEFEADNGTFLDSQNKMFEGGHVVAAPIRGGERIIVPSLPTFGQVSDMYQRAFEGQRAWNEIWRLHYTYR